MSKNSAVAELVETPTAAGESLALMTEVVAKRREVAQDLRIQLSNVRHAIQTERITWDDQRRQEELALRQKALCLEQAVEEKVGKADQLSTARLEAFQQAENERQAAVRERSALQQDRAVLGNLTQERVEVERFRLEVTRQHQDASSKFQEAQGMLNTASQRHEEATKRLAEVEPRTAHLSTWQSELDAKQAALDVPAKHLNTVQEAIGTVIEKLPVPERAAPAPLMPAADQAPVTTMEAPPSATLP